MAKKRKTKEQQHLQDTIKAIHIAGRQEQFERNGGGQWVAMNRPHKNKKKYDRKQMNKEMRDLSPYSLYFWFKKMTKIVYTNSTILSTNLGRHSL